MRSLRARLFAAWTLSLLAAGVVGVMLTGLYRESAGVQQQRAAEAAAAACGAIADGWSFYSAGWAGPLPAEGTPEAASLQSDLANLLSFTLAPYPGIEGGFWRTSDERPLAATGRLPPALRAAIAALIAGDEHAADRIDEPGGTLLLSVCPARGPFPGVAAFTAARVSVTPGQRRLVAGLGGLFALVALMTVLLGWAALAWSRRIGGIENALARADHGALPQLAPTGERDLDRIVGALNSASARLSAAQTQAAALSLRVAQSERLAALGRIAAGVAHEVRNPIAAMRLRAENGLAGDDTRRRSALEAILGQVARLERLTGELLAMTQVRQPTPAPALLRSLLEAVAADHDGPIEVAAPDMTVNLDDTLLRRALDELLANALRHAPSGTTVGLTAALADGVLTIDVTDQGEGVSEELQGSIFEPFVTDRPNGTGLGLAIAHEMVEAMGGTLTLHHPGPAPVFRITLPCPAS
jgi:signal transduction histidine kinase